MLASTDVASVQRDRREYCDDRNGHHHFDQRESAMPVG
jgi:hypothetical protein